MPGFKPNSALGEVGFSQSGGMSYDPAAMALFAEMDVQPDAARKMLINTAITGWISAGVWSKFDTLYVTAAHADQAGLLNWVAPTTYEMTKVNAPTFTVDRGFAGDGLTSYLSTGYTFGTGTNFIMNSASTGVYINVTGSAGYACGAYNGAFSGLIYNDGANTNGYLSSSTPLSFASPGSGLLSYSGNGTNLNGYRNGALQGTVLTTTQAGNGVPDILCGYGIGGVIAGGTTSRIATRFNGGFLSDAENLAFYNILNTYLTAIGGN